ncbi:MAG: flagellar biosynthesis protein FlhB [Oscillospiraceae bacterium]|jgi:flagellar biosynthetic protein FlhB|nr:flagellar biosynthesis protein FlhB [Oscillospiraceae bacterium]
MGEKTEKATPKKRKEARGKGQVLKSTEVNTAFCSLVMFAVLLVILPTFVRNMAAGFGEFLSPSAILPLTGEISTVTFHAVFLKALNKIAQLMLPIAAAALAAGVLVNLIQVGFLFTTKPLQPKAERISILKGFGRIFSVRTLVELLKSLLKVSVIGYVIYGEYRKALERFPMMMGLDIYASLLEILKTAFTIALKATVAFAVIAAADFLFQRWKYEKDLMMSKQEIKDEDRLSEGNPETKSRIRSKQRQMSASRMMQRVPSADVVITNPTHYAVALKYVEGEDDAPVVIAKGQDYLAIKIKEVARANYIQLVENRPLAQALYASCEIDQAIPEELYQAVADVLAFVRRQKEGRRTRA